MTKQDKSIKLAKWQQPKLTEFEVGVPDVQNGYSPGVDGDGGSSTSLS